MKDSVASVVRAYLDVVILSLLEKGDSYGYAVIREVERVSGGACILQEGPLYIEFRRIEQAGWKGRSLGPAAVYDRQALVLVNKGGATGADIQKLCEAIRKDVAERFGTLLEPEVNLINNS